MKKIALCDTTPQQCCMFDQAAGKLRDMDGLAVEDADVSVMNDLLALGCLYTVASEFGDMEFRVNNNAFSLTSCSALEEGSRNPIRHVALASPQKCCKLTNLMLLHALGWQPVALGERAALRYYISGAERFYREGLQQAKLYFSALASSDTILRKLSAVMSEDSVPIIHHGMPESYYKALIQLHTAADLARLVAILDRAPAVASIGDSPFAALLGKDHDDDTGDDTDGENVLPALLDDPCLVPDVQATHRLAAAVLTGLPADRADLRSTWSTPPGDNAMKVMFDNCSHSSGKQRCYIACPRKNKGHPACFKYATCELFPSEERAAAWLCAWADGAVGKDGPEFDKEWHKKFEPLPADVERFLAVIRQD